MIQKKFAHHAKQVLAKDPNVLGLAVGGSWLTNELDEFSDLDLILVTKEKIAGDTAGMLAVAKRLGNFLSGFTGEHVGEPRALICLYDDPLLHVDIKFLTLPELAHRVENPHLLFDRDGVVRQSLDKTEAEFPMPDYQWIEDRFWTWVHYALLKIGRGEYLEAHDFFAYLRLVVLGPMLHIKNGNLPRAMRKVETDLAIDDLADLKSTIPAYEKKALLTSLRNAVNLYQKLAKSLFGESIVLRKQTQQKVMAYFDYIQSR